MAALAAQVANAQAHAPAGAERFAGVDGGARSTRRAALAALPVTRKPSCSSGSARRWPTTRSAASPRSAGAPAAGGTARARVFVSPGPIYEPESARPDYWRMGARPVRRRLSRRRPGAQHLQLSLHPGRRDDGERRALAIGCTVFPAGTGQTEQQLQAMAELRPDAYVGTPSFLTHPAREGRRDGRRPAVAEEGLGRRRGLPGGAARLARGARHRRPTRATAPPISASSPTRPTAREGLVVDEGVIVEIVRPGTGDPVAEGEVGEVVVTTLNPGLPADPLRHRRPVGGAARALPDRPHQPRASAAGSAAPTSRPRCAACSSTRRRSPRSRAAIPRSKSARLVVERRERRRPDDAARSRSKAPRPRAWPSASPRRSATSPSCAATVASARRAACRTTAR